ncbi:hypothetical protein JH298_21870 (plasmid) [Xanthomonas campestris pv. campestris]|uniref:TrfB-related DNA-binding protein n=1 Tax=Xanthomonas TaxID=338 RepID=UPI000CEEBE5F|nr:TrfB-related DNA-binding protein [Xanthomonas arboricola]PPU05601.1 hypothetical protein XarjCFBP1022_20150 [Xanthomonas arboricola]WDJ74938.1 hypothetical protein JH298_21870 [Xanthomonas campestris pv. campestris]
MRRKKLSDEAFAKASAQLGMSEKTLDIARRVLVSGERQKDVATAHGLSPQTVNDHVQRVWKAWSSIADLPAGTVRITVVLSEERAQTVLAWEREEQIKRIDLPNH